MRVWPSGRGCTSVIRRSASRPSRDQEKAVCSVFFHLATASAIFSWLYAFNVINSSNRFVASLGQFFYNVTEPVLRPIRRVLPDLGGIDISPSYLYSKLESVQ